jgi:hypothetical protein
MAHRSAARPRPVVDAARAFISSGRTLPPSRVVVSRPCWRVRRSRYWRRRTGSILPPIRGLILSQSGFPGAASM